MAQFDEENGGRSKNAKQESEDKKGKKVESKKEKETTISYFALFRFTDWKEWLLIIVGSIAAIVSGVAFPFLFILIGNMVSFFAEPATISCGFTCSEVESTMFSNESSTQPIYPPLDGIFPIIYNFLYVAVVALFFGIVQVICWVVLAIRQSTKIRLRYFKAIIGQDITFHDVTSAGELNSRMNDIAKEIKDGIGEKVANAIQFTAQAVCSVVVAFVYSYRIALVNLALVPFLAVVAAGAFKMVRAFTTKEANAYASAGSIAEEAISSIRTVVAFGCQEKEIEKYGNAVGQAKEFAIKKQTLTGSTPGIIKLISFAMFGVSFGYGGRLVVAPPDGYHTLPGDFVTALFCVLFGAISLGTIYGNLPYFAAAKAAGSKVFNVIDRVHEINVFSDEGEKPDNLISSIRLNDVCFNYPTRPNVEVLRNINIQVEPGQTIALVGKSGSGKSTIIQLLQRFYDVKSGSVNIGGHDVKSLNLHWLRSQIGVVSQEPVLFATTIRENIRWGREGATDEEIEEAAKQANAYEFIMKLPEQFDTMVGDKGSQMSGGQKQRIAIARAIVRNPKILLLDEATSALDAKSEKIVQEALEKVSHGRTTIVIAHRLSTFRNSDRIFVLSNGEIVEEGTHKDLMQIDDGVYRNLVDTQAFAGVKEENNIEKEEGDTDEEKFDSSNEGNDDEMKDAAETNEERKKEKVEEKEEVYPDVPFWEVMSHNKPELHYIIVGCIFSVLTGVGEPMLGLLMGKVFGLFSLTSLDEQLYYLLVYGLVYFAIGLAGFITYTVEAYLFAKSGMELVVRLRKATFRAILRQDIAYFDDQKNNNPGSLCSKLSTDAYKVQGSTGIRIGSVIQNATCLIVALVIAFVHSWHLSLLMILLIPLITFAGFLHGKVISGQSLAEKKGKDEGACITTEAISNIRTVASLSRERDVLQMLEKSLKAPDRIAHKNALLAGFATGYGFSLPFFLNPAIWRLGVYLVEERIIPFENIFIVMYSVVFAGRAVGITSTYVPDFKKAKQAANRVLGLLKQVPVIDAYSYGGILPTHCRGEVTLRSVYFNYPARPDHELLRDFNLTVKSGETLALVGSSGSGKSTTVQLIERFYDVDQGQLSIDGMDVKDINVSWLRQQIGIVSQEPVLFDQTIKENILYGDCSRTPSDEEVIEAATNANIHDFINSLPEKYDTKVGSQGSQLSGGQKQRVAIARALLRNPKILLLDEATSALDAESEKIVQETLDAAREGRTSIVIAHRLSTVKKADQIAVIENGRIVEVGKHEELLSQQGAYYKLVNAQMQE